MLGYNAFEHETMSLSIHDKLSVKLRESFLVSYPGTISAYKENNRKHLHNDENLVYHL